ncbi:hypothetical protein [Paracoccus rhizosphaerae]|uniref:hypothetical protein n=1 Tax=Paracoccus rhizosphaerae TaxID=1133347 RepID=UPI00223F7ED7|nr:hypothetical protein [Paracoccus rhizosphaerae]
MSKLRPLIVEINAAPGQNRDPLAQSQPHVANLAHLLKTTLSAVANQLPSDHAGQALIMRMNRLIGWHLRRARQAGPRSLGKRTPAGPMIDDLLLVLSRWPTGASPPPSAAPGCRLRRRGSGPSVTGSSQSSGFTHVPLSAEQRLQVWSDRRISGTAAFV